MRAVVFAFVAQLSDGIGGATARCGGQKAIIALCDAMCDCAMCVCVWPDAVVVLYIVSQ